jgi:hypothetical protein
MDRLEIILICIIVFLVYTLSYKEHLNTVGYNNTDIPDNPLTIPYFMNTKAISNSLQTILPDNNIDWSTYNIHNDLLPFPFNIGLTKMLVDYLKNNIVELKNDNLEITPDFSNIHWKDDGDDRIFIFNAHLINNTVFVSRNLRVKIRIKMIKNFLKNNQNIQFAVDTDYQDTIPYSLLSSSINILSIRLESEVYPTESIHGIDALEPTFFLIKNELSLMYPYATSRKESAITEIMKIKFKSIIEEHAKRLQSLSK